MPKNIGTDQNYLLTDQYKDSSNLDARAQLHALYSTAARDWHPWVFDHFMLANDAHLLELGCGPCYLWAENIDRVPTDWTITLSDFSAGMIAQAQENLGERSSRFTFRQIDAQSLPFDNDSLDAIVANHMLYHIPDLSKALTEISRVLKPSGRFFAATNGANHLRQLGELRIKFMQENDINIENEFNNTFGELGFTLENGDGLIGRYFSSVDIHRYESGLDITEVAPLLAYINSGFRFESEIESGSDISDFLTAEMDVSGGVIHIDKDTGLFEANGPIKP